MFMTSFGKLSAALSAMLKHQFKRPAPGARDQQREMQNAKIARIADIRHRSLGRHVPRVAIR
jgi:hypothetical protein